MTKKIAIKINTSFMKVMSKNQLEKNTNYDGLIGFTSLKFGAYFFVLFDGEIYNADNEKK